MDEQDLPEQFSDPTAGFNQMQRQWYADLQNGAEVHSRLAQESRSYAEVVHAFRSAQGKTAGETYWQMQLRHKRERNQCLASSDTPPERISKAEVSEYIGKGLDDIEAGKRPNVTGYARERGSSARHIRAVQQRDTTRSNAAAFEQHREHPVLKLIADHGKATDMNNGTVTRSLRKVGEQYTLAQRVAALEARLSAIEHRHELEDAGINLREEAVRLYRQNGLGYKAIAKRIGSSPSSVRNWIKADTSS